MTLNSHAATLAHARRRRTGVMVDTCRIVRPGESVWNPNTGEYDSTSTVLYEGPCQLKQYQPGQVIGSEQSGIVLTVTGYLFSIPWAQDHYGITEADHVEYEGRTYEVNSLDRGTNEVATRVVAIDQAR